MPTRADLPFPYDAVSGYQDLKPLDLSVIGIAQTPLGVFSQCESLWVPSAEQGISRLTLLYRPTGITLPPGTLAPLDLLVCSKSSCRSSSVIRPHVLGREMPEGSFCKISDHLYVTSPTLTFVQNCLTHRLLPNIELGLEWCGTYALSAPSRPRRLSPQPLLQVCEIQAYLDGLKGIGGAGSARKATKWLVDGLASPRETELYLTMVLPPALGGFGLPRPLVNEMIALEGAPIGRQSPSSYFVVDFLYPHRKLVIEYDGREDHETSEQDIINDKERRSALAVMGYTVIVVTRHDLKLWTRLVAKIEQIATALGLALPLVQEPESKTQKALAQWLFNPRHDHLPFGFGY